MPDVKPKPKGSLLRPLKALSYLFREPVTLPLEPRPASARYRGFHMNDWKACIGCGTCALICDNQAIRMVDLPDLPANPVKGVRARRPAIDYGRCCWCALCVDICPTGSLALSREYIHVESDLDTFFILPNETGMHHRTFPHGWSKGADNDLLDPVRQPMSERDPARRIGDFEEIVTGFDSHGALVEASRCVQCGLCHDSCPAHMHAPEYIKAIGTGDLDEAVRQIYRTNPFPHVCGRVCTHRCEAACAIGRRGEPVAIRWLKRFAMDSLPSERVRAIALAGQTPSAGQRRAAIIGSGPGGLTVAWDLARAGWAVTVFEAYDQPGGMMRYGIPAYRLPAARLDDDIAVIAAAGVDIRCAMRIGSTLPFEDVRRDAECVILATGLWRSRSTRIPGSDHPQVRSAIDLLRRLRTGETIAPPRRAVVIGGGNVAMDIARSLARLQTEAFGNVAVLLACLEEREHMLADAGEIREAEEEGVLILAGRGPKRIVAGETALGGLESVHCLSIFDASGRFHPCYDESDTQFHPADLVVEAIGQTADLEFLGPELIEALEWHDGRLEVDDSGRTSLPWLWALGDMVEGPDVIHAITAGHRTAQAVMENERTNERTHFEHTDPGRDS